jgi:flagellar motor switch protein FliN/FliY
VVTQLGERLIPVFEQSSPAAAQRLGIPGVDAGDIVPVDDIADALPVGPVRRVRGAVADGAGIDVVLALTDIAAGQTCAALGSGDDLVAALLPALNAVLATVGNAIGASLELADVVEMGANEPLAVSGAEAYTAGLFIGEDQIGNLIFIAAPGALTPSDRVNAAAFPSADDIDGGSVNPLSLLRGVEMRVTAELGRTRLPVSHVLDLGPGAVVELDRVAGSPVDVLVNGTIIAHGEVVVIDEEYGVRITEIIGAEDD